MMKLGIPRTLLATALALVIPIALVSGLWAEGGQPKTDASPSPLAKGLIGTWDFAGTPDKEEEPPAKGGRLKFITGGNILTGAGVTGGESGQPWRGFDPSAGRQPQRWGASSSLSSIK